VRWLRLPARVTELSLLPGTCTLAAFLRHELLRVMVYLQAVRRLLFQLFPFSERADQK
jgi:hypothetical protein